MHRVCGEHFIIDDINYQLDSSFYVDTGGHCCATLIKIHIHSFDGLVYWEIELINHSQANDFKQNP